jgi:hypothetical protein
MAERIKQAKAADNDIDNYFTNLNDKDKLKNKDIAYFERRLKQEKEK